MTSGPNTVKAELEAAIEEHEKKSRAPILAFGILTGVISGAGFLKLYTNVTYEVFLAAAIYGFLVTLLMSTVWTRLLAMASKAKTRAAWGVIAFGFVLALATTLSISAPTNVFQFLHEPTKTYTEQQKVERVSNAATAVQMTGTQLSTLQRFLAEHRAVFQSKYQAEFNGENSRGGGAGPISNSYLAAAELLLPPISSVEADLRRYEGLKSTLDEKVGLLRQVPVGQPDAKAELEAAYNEIVQVIGQIAAIDPRTHASNAAAQVARNIPTPPGAKEYAITYINAIQADLRVIEGKLKNFAETFETVDLVDFRSDSPIDQVLKNAWRYWPITLAAIGIDLLSPMLFLFKLPAMISLHAQLRKEQERREKANEALPYPGDVSLAEWVHVERQVMLAKATLNAEAKKIGVEHRNLIEDARDFYGQQQNIEGAFPQKTVHDVSYAPVNERVNRSEPITVDYDDLQDVDELYEDFMLDEGRAA